MNFYNEEEYLNNPNKDFFDKIEKFKIYYYSNSIHDSVLYKEVIEKYKVFIKKCSELVFELGLPNNALSYSFVIDRLISKGIFSCQKNFSYKEGIQLETCAKLGLNVVLGAGSCRHLSFFHKDIFDKLNIKDEILSISVNNSKKSNHIINLINLNGVEYGYDITNSDLFKFTDSLNLIDYYGKSIKYKPYMNMQLLGLSLDDIKKQLEEYEINSKKDTIKFEEYKEILNDTLNRMDRYYSYIRSFKKDTADEKKFIKRNFK